MNATEYKATILAAHINSAAARIAKYKNNIGSVPSAHRMDKMFGEMANNEPTNTTETIAHSLVECAHKMEAEDPNEKEVLCN